MTLNSIRHVISLSTITISILLVHVGILLVHIGSSYVSISAECVTDQPFGDVVVKNLLSNSNFVRSVMGLVFALFLLGSLMLVTLFMAYLFMTERFEYPVYNGKGMAKPEALPFRLCDHLPEEYRRHLIDFRKQWLRQKRSQLYIQIRTTGFLIAIAWASLVIRLQNLVFPNRIT